MVPPQRGPLHAATQPALQHIGRSYLRPGSPRASPRVWANAGPWIPAGHAPQRSASCARPPRNQPPRHPSSLSELRRDRPTAPPPDPAGHIMPLLTPPHAFLLRPPGYGGTPPGILAGRASTTPAASPGRTCSGAATAHFWHRCPGRDGGAFALPAAGPRVKRNLFVSRPLFHLTRAPTRRPEARIGFAFANPDGDQDLSASFGMLRGEAKAGWSVVVGRQGGSDGPGSR